MDEFLLTSWHIYRWHHLWYLYVAALLSSSSSVVTVSLFVSYLHPPLLLLAGRLGADKFGREQAKGGQTRSLCVYIAGRETCWGGGEVATTDRVQLRPGGGVSGKKKTKSTVHLFYASAALTDFCVRELRTCQQHTAIILWISAVINGYYMWACAAKNS